ncbi:MAG: hypothetical protein ACXACA_04345 [Candidatus Ranarchaeia archaeon]|jgi:hypothetical protein
MSNHVHDEELQEYEECRSCHENLLRSTSNVQLALPRANGMTEAEKQRYRLSIMDHNIADALYWISISKGFAHHKQIRKYLKLKNIRRNMVERYNKKRAITA